MTVQIVKEEPYWSMEVYGDALAIASDLSPKPKHGLALGLHFVRTDDGDITAMATLLPADHPNAPKDLLEQFPVQNAVRATDGMAIPSGRFKDFPPVKFKDLFDAMVEDRLGGNRFVLDQMVPGFVETCDISVKIKRAGRGAKASVVFHRKLSGINILDFSFLFGPATTKIFFN